MHYFNIKADRLMICRSADFDADHFHKSESLPLPFIRLDEWLTYCAYYNPYVSACMPFIHQYV